MPEESEVHHPSGELSLTELMKLRDQNKRIETEDGIKTAEELLRGVRGVLERVFHNASLKAEQEVGILPQCLRAAVRKCILAARKSIPVNDLSDDKKFGEWIEKVEEEKIHW